MKLYVEAIDEAGRVRLGSMDGQTVFRCANYRRTHHYRLLVSGAMPRRPGINRWRVVTDRGDVVEEITARRTYAEYRSDHS
jgi:hypothetical protein